MAIAWPPPGGTLFVLLVGLIMGFLALSLWLPVRVELEYHRLPSSWGTGRVHLRLLGGLIRFRLRLRLDQQVDQALSKLLDARRPKTDSPKRPGFFGRLARAAIAPLLRTLAVREASLDLRLGTGDAAQTAILTGALWGVLGSAYGYALSRVRHGPRQPQLAIAPDFGALGWLLTVDFLCIIEARPGHIIAALLAAAGSAVRKGGIGRGRASHSGSHEDGHGEHQRYG